jgi:hypothetical protein
MFTVASAPNRIGSEISNNAAVLDSVELERYNAAAVLFCIVTGVLKTAAVLSTAAAELY